MGAAVTWWARFVAWLRPLPQIVQVPQAPITVHVAAPEPPPFVRGTCAGCAYWLLRDKSAGECRAHAPTNADRSTLNRPLGFWPLTASSEWCGDFRRV